jgi:hypothetical protein
MSDPIAGWPFRAETGLPAAFFSQKDVLSVRFLLAKDI